MSNDNDTEAGADNRTDTITGGSTGAAASAPPRLANPKLSTAQAVRLVASREVQARLRSKSFLISTAVLLLIVLASIVVSGIVAANAELPKVAVQRSIVNALPEATGFETVLVDDADEAEQLVRDGEAEAAVVVDPQESQLGYLVLGLDEAPTGIISQLSIAPNVEVLEPADQDPFVRYLVAFAFGLLFFLSAITFGSTIAQSVVEEKQTRIVELLLATISARLLLAGKVVGNSILAFGQTALIVAVASIGLLVTGQRVLLGEVGPSVLWFVVFFVFGFVLLAAMFAASAALVSRQEDLGGVLSPVTTLVMAPYFAVIFFNDNDLVLAIMSYIPFSAPVGMPLRLFIGTAQWWEPLLSLLILLASTVVVIVLGARIYSNSLLRTGTRVKLGEALRG